MSSPLRRLLGRLLPFRRTVAAIVVAIVLEQTFDAYLRYSIKTIIDALSAPQSHRMLLPLLGLLATGILVTSATSIGRDLLMAKMGAQLLNGIRRDFHRHLQHLPVSFYHRVHGGDILSRFTTDMAAVENTVVMAFPAALISLIGCLVAAIPLFWISPLLAGAAIALLPLQFLGPAALKRRATLAGQQMRRSQANVSSHLHEHIRGQLVVKAFGVQGHAMETFQERLGALLPRARRSNFLDYLVARLPLVSGNALEFLVVAAGVWLTSRQDLSVGSFVAFYVLYSSLSASVWGITWAVPILIQGGVSFERIDEFRSEDCEPPDAPGTRTTRGFSDSIRFQGVGFSHDGKEPILDGLDLTIRKGMQVAVVGKSGSGKSTIATLLLRLHEPQAGTIHLDGRPLSSYTRQSLRGLFGTVFQENPIFHATVAENIAMGDPGIDHRRIVAAAKDAGIHEQILSLPNGYGTRIGESARRLSGGEQQRIALARALARNPDILLLDEATSALDPATEASIGQTLSRLARTRTIVSFTHKLTHAKEADLIVVLEEGKVAQQGRHEELLAQGGAYRGMWQASQLEASA